MTKWKMDHDPFKVPLGCNGKPGESGLMVHKAKGTEVCKKCRDASNWARRERKRGNPIRKPKSPIECGTIQGANRHRGLREKRCFKCRMAEVKYNAEITERVSKNKLHEIKSLLKDETPAEEFKMLVSIIVGAKS